MNLDKLAKLQAQVRIGGKGTPRRKIKKTSAKSGGDDKKLLASLKKMHVQPIPLIEEANFFSSSGKVLHFQAPKVQASIAANLFVVSGTAQEKNLTELMPGILMQMGQESLQNLKMLADHMQNYQKGQDDVPDLVEDFDQVE